jgi:hypothetical protein
MSEAVVTAFGSIFLFFYIIKEKWAWRIGFLMNIGIGIPFYGGAVLATLQYFVDSQSMTLRIILLYIPFLVITFGKKEKLLDFTGVVVSQVVFAALWSATCIFPEHTVDLLVGYFVVMVVYFYYADYKRNGWRREEAKPQEEFQIEEETLEEWNPATRNRNLKRKRNLKRRRHNSRWSYNFKRRDNLWKRNLKRQRNFQKCHS